MPKFSIIVPIYKVEKYLTQCLNSILNQSVEDFECILVDDGSPDNCPDICDEYEKKDGRIRVIHKENGGLSSARNAGLDIAQGDYILFVDSDDYLALDALEKISIALEQTNSDAIVFNHTPFNDNTLKRFLPKLSPHDYILTDEQSAFIFLSQTLLQYKIGWEAWSRVYKRSIIAQHNLRFYDNKKIYAEDLLFNTIYSLHVKKITIIPDRLYFYRLRNDSIVGLNKDSKVPEFICLTKILYDYLLDHNFEYIKARFYALFYLIMANRYKQSSLTQRTIAIYSLPNPEFFEQYTKEVYKNRKKIKQHIGYCIPHKEQFEYLYYLDACKRGRKKKISTLKTKIIIRIKRFYLWIVSTLIKKPIRKVKCIPDKLWRKNLYLIGTEEVGNIGDNLIAMTELAFLKEHFPNYNIIEVPVFAYGNMIEDLSIKIKVKDPLFLTGGGNIGDLYPEPIAIKADVFKRFPKNKITIFPQTIYFRDCNKQIETRAQYEKVKNLNLVTRERYSYDLARTIFPKTKTLLTPDIVFYRSLQIDEPRQNIIRLCLRNDTEKTLSPEEKAIIDSALNDFNVERFDMQLPYWVTIKDREFEVEQVLSLYRTAKLIITDRLHGMVVSAVTGTPCIVLPSETHKTKGTYEWIADLPYIRFANDANEIPALLEELLSLPPCKYDPSRFAHYFDQILES